MTILAVELSKQNDRTYLSAVVVFLYVISSDSLWCNFDLLF